MARLFRLSDEAWGRIEPVSSEIWTLVRSSNEENLEVSVRTRIHGRRLVDTVAMPDAERQSSNREKRKFSGRI